MREKKLVFGIGLNDLGYPVKDCPFYAKWKYMHRRCYHTKKIGEMPTYSDKTVHEDWHLASNFKSWMQKQDWKGKELDKDLLYPKNTVYGPDTCCFISKQINYFMTERQNHRGEYPIGVHWSNKDKVFVAAVSMYGKQTYLGAFSTPEEAHQAWLDKKIEMAYTLASQQSDPRVAAALIDRYENYEKYFGGVSSQELM